MSSRTGAWARLGNIAGWTAVLAALALFSPGVSTVRAGDDPLMSSDPGLVAAQAQKNVGVAPAQAADPGPAPANTADVSEKPPSQPFVRADDVENARRPGVSGIEIQPGVVVLNTRGYNYGPPPTPLAPEALEQETAPH